MRVSIVGSGVTGQATGKGLIDHGHDVIFYDIDYNRLAEIKGNGYIVSENIFEAVSKSEVIFVCVPTPTVNGKMDFQYVEAAVTNIAKQLEKIKDYKVVVLRSTVLPSTTRCKVIPLLELHSKLKSGKDFGVCMNPEFLREKTADQDFLKPWRIVIGELDTKSGDALVDLYSSFRSQIFRTQLDVAELIKYVANIFLATKISFFNEIYLLSKVLDIDSNLVSKIVALDPRIGEYGVYGGRHFDGGCLPKDLEAFLDFVKEKSGSHDMLECVFEINEAMKKY